jgi:soluble lytic murein transglycosylase-like protein
MSFAHAQQSAFPADAAPIGSSANITIKLPERIPSECVVNAAARYQVPEMALLAILKQESGGRTGIVSPNTNGSKDYGPAQFNDRSWGGYMQRKYGITLADLTNNMCQAIMAQAYAVRSIWNDCITKGNSSIWCAIANYHSPTPKYQDIYVRQVWKRYSEMVAMGAF